MYINLRQEISCQRVVKYGSAESPGTTPIIQGCTKRPLGFATNSVDYGHRNPFLNYSEAYRFLNLGFLYWLLGYWPKQFYLVYSNFSINRQASNMISNSTTIQIESDMNSYVYISSSGNSDAVLPRRKLNLTEQVAELGYHHRCWLWRFFFFDSRIRHRLGPVEADMW